MGIINGGFNMKKALARQIARLWNEKHSNYTSGTTTFATAKEDTAIHSVYSVIISPTGDNDGTCFYQCAELTGIEKAFNVHSYIACRTGKCVAIIF
jgi:hypothetical protein